MARTGVRRVTDQEGATEGEAAGSAGMVPELPELPEGMGLPAIDPTAKGGWQAPDDLVVSITPLWPRPNRSWRWIVAWLLMVVRMSPPGSASCVQTGWQADRAS